MEQVNEYPNATPAISNNGFLLLVAVFPVVFAWALTVLIKAFVPFSTIGADTAFASIDYPQNNLTISRNYQVSGVTKQDFADEFLFVIEESNGAVYPKSPVANSAGSWSANLYTGAPAGMDFRIVLVAVNQEDKAAFEAWFKHGEQTGQWSGLSASDSMRELTAVRVQVADE
jgi:hypothetical protein